MVDGGVGEEDWGIAQDVVVAKIGASEALLVRLRAPGTTRHLLVVCERRKLAVGLVAAETRDEARAAIRAGEPSADAVALRVALEGGRFVGGDADGVVFDGPAGRLIVFAVAASKIGVRDASDTSPAPLDEDEARRRGGELATRLAEVALDGERARIVKIIAKAIDRLERRVAAIRGDLDRIAVAEGAAVRARLFVAEIAKAPRGARSLSVTDWSTGETIELPLDPSKGAREQLDAIFKRAKRLKEGARFGAQRRGETEAIIATLRPLEALVRDAPDLAALETVAVSARAAAPRDIRGLAPSQPGRRAKTVPTPPHRTFTGAEGQLIFVGRGAAQNDALTLHVAKPHDLWLHAKGEAGAHVVVPLPKGSTCPGELLVDAAHLAAHFSKARDEPITEVTYVPKRYVRKPRGSAPGLVVVDREKVLTLRRDADRIARLLASERIDS
jgi:NFACT protein RNA binding domain/NFACT N-terminal and middle domains